jgi:hypothetical protein
VAHSFAKPFPKEVEIQLPGAGWKVGETWPAKNGLTLALSARTLKLGLGGANRAVVAVLEKR